MIKFKYSFNEGSHKFEYKTDEKYKVREYHKSLRLSETGAREFFKRYIKEIFNKDIEETDSI